MLNKGLMTSDKNYWETPQMFFDELNKEFNDLATNNAIIRTYITVLWYHQILRRDKSLFYSHFN